MRLFEDWRCLIGLFIWLSIILLSSFCILKRADAAEFQYPLGFSVEDFHSINSYVTKTGMGGGFELAFYGSSKKYLAKYIHFKAPDLHIGVTVNQKKTPALYFSPAGKLFTKIGFGAAVKGFLRYVGSDEGFGLTTALYGFYHVPKIIFPHEWLVVYVGLKSDESVFSKEDWKIIVEKAYNLYGSKAPVIFGFYYTWDLANSYAVGFETDLTKFKLLFYFGERSFL